MWVRKKKKKKSETFMYVQVSAMWKKNLWILANEMIFLWNPSDLSQIY